MTGLQLRTDFTTDTSMKAELGLMILLIKGDKVLLVLLQTKSAVPEVVPISTGTKVYVNYKGQRIALCKGLYQHCSFY